MSQRLRCPDPGCNRPLTPFQVTAQNIRAGHFPRDFDRYFQRSAWACYPCRANLFIAREGVDAMAAADLLRMGLWGWYLNKAGHQELREVAEKS